MGAAFELASVSYEPTLYSTGYAGHALRVRLLAIAVLVIAILGFVSFGPVGVGWAVALAMSVFYFAMSVTVWMILRQLRRKAAAA